MAKIIVLDKQVAELIAAGEVVERPSSIVKELIENAIDAGASKITVEIKGGGIKYIRVTDDGMGIEKDEIPTAFIRHATSKVKTKEDLEEILTFGFRGEALPSIAAMCRVELITRTHDNPVGSRYVIEGEKEGVLSEIGAPVGTSLIVRDVFFNTPARLKFLKKDSYEGSNIQAIVERIALINTHVAFKLIKDNQTVLASPGNGDLKSAIHCVMGREFAKDLLEVSYSEGALSVSGYITSPNSSRATRAMQCFYINSRYIKSKTCIAAVEDAFKGKLMTGRFPGCILNVTIPPGTVDVNVHPAKTEVRFSEEGSVYNLVYSAAKSALENYSSALLIRNEEKKAKPAITPFALKDFDRSENQFAFQKEAYSKKVITEEIKPQQIAVKPSGERITPSKLQITPSVNSMDKEWDEKVEYIAASSTVGYSTKNIKEEIVYDTKIDITKEIKPDITQEKLEDIKEIPQNLIEEIAEVKSEDIRVIGELLQTYILVEKSSGMILIDKHAAHESALYNKLKSSEYTESQQLLSPLTLQLNHEEIAVFDGCESELLRLGIEAERFGSNAVIVRGVPTMLSSEQTVEVLKELVSKPFRKDFLPKVLDELYHSMACKAAIKAGNLTGADELKFIAELVGNDNNISHCPHGRPVTVELSKGKIERMFGRSV